MGLSAFLRENIEAILDEWQEFAASIPSAKEMNRGELRNDAQEILLAIARDLDNAQSLEQQRQKSKGRQPRLDTSDTAAESHGLARFASGFDIKEMVSEYRALRGTVVRLWVVRAPDAATGTLDELTRFNEGIDQALTESVRFRDQVDESRQGRLHQMHRFEHRTGASRHSSRGIHTTPGHALRGLSASVTAVGHGRSTRCVGSLGQATDPWAPQPT